MKTLVVISIAFLSRLFVSTALGQTYPQVGDQAKDHMFTELVNFPKKQVSISDFRGQWLIIDLWTRSCSGCIKSFPKMDKLGKDFKGKAQLLMVALYNDKDDKNHVLTTRIFEMHKKKYDLDFALAYDTLFDKKYGAAAVPFILVINPEGEIMAKITALDSAQLAGLIAGKKDLKFIPAITQGESRGSRNFSNNLPLLTKGDYSNGGIDTSFVARSMIVKWNENMPVGEVYSYSARKELNQNKSSRTAEAIGFTIEGLLRMAYTGFDNWSNSGQPYNKVYPKIIYNLESGHKPFNQAEKFAYSATFPNPKTTNQQVNTKLKADLESFFEFSSSLEEREVFAWKLVVVDPKKILKLKSTRGTGKNVNKRSLYLGYSRKNISIGQFITSNPFFTALQAKYDDLSEIPPIVDATGIDYNIDLEFESNNLDMDDVRAKLREKGLDFVEGTARMKAIVVSDKKPEESMLSIFKTE